LLTITAVAGVAAPGSPGASFSNPDIVLPSTVTNPVTVNVSGTNIPVATVVTVTVKGQTGSASSASGALSGTAAASNVAVSLNIPSNQPSVISATASFAILASTGAAVFVEGEEVERVRVTVSSEGAAQVAYVTKSGRAVVVAGQ
jgi:hypothetical protein